MIAWILLFGFIIAVAMIMVSAIQHLEARIEKLERKTDE